MNIICDNALLTTYAESKKTVSADMIKEAARDLRIESPIRITTAQSAPPIFESKTKRQVPTRQVTDEAAGRRTKHAVSAGVGMLLGILAFAGIASVIAPQNLLNTAGKIPDPVKHIQQPVPRKVKSEVKFKREDQQITIEYGATIYKIAIDAYGENTVLGMDLIKEFNPQIENLNWIFAGGDLLLPPLTRETLLRQQPDGSYHLIAGSFRSRAGADEYARFLRNKGYQVTIKPRQVSDDLFLHRVEIDGLKNLEEADEIWQSGVTNQWLAFADNRERTR